MSNLPKPDNSAYDGSIIVKTKTAHSVKQDDSVAEEVDRVRRAVDALNKEVEKRMTIDKLNLSVEHLASLSKVLEKPLSAIEFQMFLNKEVSGELRKVIGVLGNFLRNNK